MRAQTFCQGQEQEQKQEREREQERKQEEEEEQFAILSLSSLVYFADVSAHPVTVQLALPLVEDHREAS